MDEDDTVVRTTCAEYSMEWRCREIAPPPELGSRRGILYVRVRALRRRGRQSQWAYYSSVAS